MLFVCLPFVNLFAEQVPLTCCQSHTQIPLKSCIFIWHYLNTPEKSWAHLPQRPVCAGGRLDRVGEDTAEAECTARGTQTVTYYLWKGAAAAGPLT